MIDEIIGMTIEEANTHLKKNNMICRATHIDGIVQICTRDFRYDRVNVVVENKKITEIRHIG